MNFNSQFYINKANTVYNNSFTTNSYFPFALHNELDLNSYLVASRKNTRNKIKGRSNTCQAFEGKAKGSCVYSFNTILGEKAKGEGNYSTLKFADYTLSQSNRWISPNKKIKLRNFSLSKHQKDTFNLTRPKNFHCKVPQYHTVHPQDTAFFATKPAVNSERAADQLKRLDDEQVLYDKIERCKVEEQGMVRELERLNECRSVVDNDETYAKEKEELLAKCLKIIANIDPLFSRILGEVGDYFDKLRKEAAGLREKNRNQKEIIELQKMHIDELKAKVSSLTKENASHKQNLVEDKEKLKNLESELKICREKNSELNRTIKEINNSLKDNVSRHKKKHKPKIIELPGESTKKISNKSAIEVGKKGVKIPILKLYRLPRAKPSKLLVRGHSASESRLSESGSPSSNESVLVVASDIDGKCLG
eukprot:TRINITY_DN3825_c0_g1_i1.p1 TRINITY_DN3825_c0_g1~~TRINITY_DN3825_c0_g1_i1.p1  ORF type:complete len:421 (-),score=108.16 TRINITY_DN3825_c0_g1_i1:104-1366(-)